MKNDSSWMAFLILFVDALISDYLQLNKWWTIILIIVSVVFFAAVEHTFEN